VCYRALSHAHLHNNTNHKVSILSQAQLLLESQPLPGNPYRRGRLSAVDLLVLTSLDQLLLILPTSFTL
jgi:hypothetical protein